MMVVENRSQDVCVCVYIRFIGKNIIRQTATQIHEQTMT